MKHKRNIIYWMGITKTVIHTYGRSTMAIVKLMRFTSKKGSLKVKCLVNEFVFMWFQRIWFCLHLWKLALCSHLIDTTKKGVFMAMRHSLWCLKRSVSLWTKKYISMAPKHNIYVSIQTKCHLYPSNCQQKKMFTIA